jgi:hypothetical protein
LNETVRNSTWNGVKQQTNNVDRRFVGAQNAVQIEHDDVRQRDKVKKKNKQMAGPRLAYVA